jgi:hypothetical protein
MVQYIKGEVMTQYKDEVDKRREELKEDQLDKEVSFIEVVYKEGKWERQMTGYKSGRRVTIFNDKRKKDKVEWF